jgi:transposase
LKGVRLGGGPLDLSEQIAEIDKLIEARFRAHDLAEVLGSMPGIGPLLGAEFLAATAGDLSRFGTPDRLASLAGVAPVPRDSGRISGNLHRPRPYDRGLQRVFYTSALISIRTCDVSRRFYERTRAEGKRHTQTVLALARRRVNVLWALIRDGRCYDPASLSPLRLDNIIRRSGPPEVAGAASRWVNVRQSRSERR